MKSFSLWKMLALMLAASAFVVAALVGLGVYYLKSHRSQLMAEGKRVMQEANEAGRGQDNTGCVELALAKDASCKGVLCHAENKIFLRECLLASKRVDGFCNGVPPPKEIMATALWRVNKCQRINRSDNWCQQIMGAIQDYCAMPIGSSPPPLKLPPS